jgi:hypothetical protein
LNSYQYCIITDRAIWLSYIEIHKKLALNRTRNSISNQADHKIWIKKWLKKKNRITYTSCPVHIHCNALHLNQNRSTSCMHPVLGPNCTVTIGCRRARQLSCLRRATEEEWPVLENRSTGCSTAVSARNSQLQSPSRCHVD